MRVRGPAPRSRGGRPQPPARRRRCYDAGQLGHVLRVGSRELGEGISRVCGPLTAGDSRTSLRLVGDQALSGLGGILVPDTAESGGGHLGQHDTKGETGNGRIPLLGRCGRRRGCCGRVAAERKRLLAAAQGSLPRLLDRGWKRRESAERPDRHGFGGLGVQLRPGRGEQLLALCPELIVAVLVDLDVLGGPEHLDLPPLAQKADAVLLGGGVGGELGGSRGNPDGLANGGLARVGAARVLVANIAPLGPPAGVLKSLGIRVDLREGRGGEETSAGRGLDVIAEAGEDCEGRHGSGWDEGGIVLRERREGSGRGAELSVQVVELRAHRSRGLRNPLPVLLMGVTVPVLQVCELGLAVGDEPPELLTASNLPLETAVRRSRSLGRRRLCDRRQLGGGIAVGILDPH